MTNLETLNLAEQELLTMVGSVTGLMEEKFQKLEENGIFAEYRKIYDNYVDLIESKTEGLEALKRALFLLWYEQAEPSCFTGISDLPKDKSQKVFYELENQIKTQKLDSELQWMLPYYNVIAEWVFETHKDFPNLQRFLDTADNGLYSRELKAENFSERGQMGDYWVSISQTFK